MTDMERLEKAVKLFKMALIILGLLTLTSISLFVGASALDREHPSEGIQYSIIGPKTATRGSILSIETVLYRRRSCLVTVNWHIYDSSNIRIYDHQEFRIGGILGYDKIRNEIIIPQSARIGAAKIRIHPTWTCPGNIIHQIWPIEGPTHEIEFTIV